MKKLLLKSLALLLALTFIISCASLAISAVSYVAGTNNVSASYKAGKYYSQLSQIPLTGNQRQDLVAVAMSQIQYMESNSSSDLSGTTGGSSNYTEFCYNFGYDIGSNYAWCAAFVTWSLRQAGINKVGTGSKYYARANSAYYWCEVSCGFWVSALKTQGYWQGSKGRYGGTYIPKSGDLIFFENGGDSWSDHIGIVVYCDGSNVYTVEGNTSGASGVVANGGRVAFKSYAIGSTSILGYGAMPYNTTSSGIDYSGANPTPGLYIADGNKYLYSSSSCSGTYVVLPKGTLVEVTEVLSSGTVLKCSYNGGTYYVSNNTDRIVQITQTSGGGSTGGGTTGGTNTSGTTYMAAYLNSFTADGTSYTGGAAYTSNQSVVNPYPFNASATSFVLKGWCMIDGGQSDSFFWSADGGTTWNDLSAVTGTPSNTSDYQTTALGLSGASSWSAISYTGATYTTSAIDLSAYAGKTITLILARASSTGEAYMCASISGITVPGGSSGDSGSSGGSGSTGGTTSGYTSTTSYQQKACIDYINGVQFTTDNEAVRFQPVSIACPSQTSNNILTVVGWDMINGGQKDLVYSVDGGTTWTACPTVTYSNGTDDHKSAAVAGGLTEAYANTTNAIFDVSLDLSAYKGQTLDVMFARVVAANTTLVSHFLTVTGVKVGGDGTSATINGTATHTNTAPASGSGSYGYIGSIDTINGNSAALGFNRLMSSPYTAVPATATGISVTSSNTIYIKGWALVNAGQGQYVYSIDGSTWYACSGTIFTPGDADASAIQSTGTNHGLSSVNLNNARFQDLTADLSGCAGHTVDVYFGVVAKNDSTKICHMLTVEDVAVPGDASSGDSTSTQVYDVAAVVNFVNGVGPDGTTETNYANDLITLNGNIPNIPIANALTATGTTTLAVNGWCIVNGGQQNTIKWSLDGGNTWKGTCSVSGFSDGTADHANAAAVWSNISNASVTGANFSNASVDLSAYKGQTVSVTFGRTGTDGTTYPFVTISEVVVPGCSHSSTTTNTTAATCTAAGSKKVVCNTCGATVSTTTIAATGHTAGAAATCTTAQTCTVCNEVIKAATGHTEVTVAGTAATCTATGLTDGKKCSVCGEVTVAQTTIAAKGHTEVTVAGKAATCTSTGLTDGKKCSACGTVTVAQTTIEMTAHKYSDSNYSFDENYHWQACTVCGGGVTSTEAHTYSGATCSVCGYGCEHVAGSAATCTTAQTCTLCGTEMTAALGHNWSTTYTTTETHHYKTCSRCSEKNSYAEHSFSGGTCVCGFAEPVELPAFNSSVDYINGVGPDGTANSPYTGLSGNTNGGTASVEFPLSSKVNFVKLQGWALVLGGITEYKWSVDGVTWNDCSYTSLSNATDDHFNACSGYGITSANTSAANSLFSGLCADLSYYANQTVNVTFAAVASDGTVVPFVTVTGVNAGTPSEVGASFDSFYVGSTITNFDGFGGGVINGVTVSGANADTGALTLSNVYAGTSLTLWGWAGYNSEIESFGYYFDNYSSAITRSNAQAAEDAVIAAGGQYAKRMKITVSTSSLVGGGHTVTFIVKFKDGSVKEMATWNLSVVESSASSGGTIAGSNGQYANVIILSGQSNAYGASPTDHSSYNIASMYGSADFSNIYIHYNNINAKPVGSDYVWQTLASNSGFEQYKVGIGGENSTRFGPELGIASYLKSAFPNETFYIVKFTAAGTNLNGQWFENDGNGADNWGLIADMGDYLYPQMVNYINESIGMIQAMDSRPIKIHAYGWVQGESDAGTAAMAASYEYYEQLMLNSLRSDFADYAADGGIAFIDYAISEMTYPETFVYGGITYQAGQGVWAYGKALNDAKRANAQYLFDTVNAATEKSTYGIGKSILINKTDWMSKWDVGYDSDRWHLSPQSMEALGKAMGTAIHFMDGKTATHAHTEQTVAGTPATCTESGISDGIKCATCGITLVEQTLIPATGHAFDSDADAECNNGCGYIRENICVHSYDSTYESDATSHWNVCTLCNKPVNTASHNYTNDCDTSCNTCGYTRVTTHTIVTTEPVPATCTSTGLSEGRACGVCGYIEQAPTVTAKLKHSYTGTVTAPTCTDRGYTTYACQNGCGKSYKASYTAATGHRYSSVVTAPTCSTRGYTTYTCALCEISYTGDYTNASGHSYTTTTVAATCTSRGYTLNKCDGCGSSYKTNFVVSTGHKYVSVTVAATCSTRGYTSYTCSGCGSSYKTNFTSAGGHNYVSVEDTAAGVIRHTCSGCGMFYVTAIPGVTLKSPANNSEVVLANNDVYTWYNTYDASTYCTSAYYHDAPNGDLYAPTHVTLEWAPVEGASCYTISISTNKDMSNSANYTVSVTAGAIQNLYVNTTYYWQITAICEDGLCADGDLKSAVYSFKTAMSPRTVYIDGVGNTRDAGGYTTITGATMKQGMIYRGGTLDNITAAGKNTMINDLGIKTDLDLRKPNEGTAGTSSPIGVNYINIDGKYYVATDETGIHSAEGKAAMANEIRAFADASNYPIYTHCSLGRDRTGTIIMIIQALLGVDKSTLMMDYELSLFSSVATQDGAALSLIKANMQSTLDYIENNYAGTTFMEKTENYVLSTGVTQAEINAIRTLMLETA
ncbi:MAG: tyrosine-protein phosphatase [Clostridia bacterium]|nr:tyrosine-protein phosphatase [Clostridia bacterium]